MHGHGLLVPRYGVTLDHCVTHASVRHLPYDAFVSRLFSVSVSVVIILCLTNTCSHYSLEHDIRTR